MRTLSEADLHEYQQYGREHIKKNSHCGLFLDMGMGKTTTTLTALNDLIYEELEIDSSLIIAPKRVAESVWGAEARKWEHLKHLKIVKIVGTPKQREAAINEAADIHIIGRDNVAWLCGLFGGSMLPWDALVIDELSSFKSWNSQRFKTLKRVQPSFDRIIGLTGTPAPNGLIDLWAQMFLLDRGERLGRTISEYRSKYFTAGARSGHVVYKYEPNKNSDALIHDQIKDICVSMKAKDYLKTKGVHLNPIHLQFSEKQRKDYDNFEKSQVLEMFSDLDPEKTISAVNAAALSNKLLQFANGAVYDEERNVHSVHDVKLDAAEEIVENANGHPVLIAYAYKHDLHRLQKRLKKYKPRTLKTDQDILDWNAGDIQVLLMHPASGGHGLNLQDGGSVMVWFGMNWSLELYEQLNKRLDRQGQLEKVIIHMLLMEGTMDEQVLRSLQRKSNTQNDLMDAVKARIKKYLKNK